MHTWKEDFLKIQASKLFDAEWYLSEHPDVCGSGLGPLEHYVKFGARLGRSPNPAFNAAEYAAWLSPGDNPLVHFIDSRPEARQPPAPPPPVDVSVVCITYNHLNYIRRALDGFLSQTTTLSYEIIIGDDCSTDGSADIIKSYARQHPQIVPVLRPKNIGSLDNFAETIQLIRGRFVALCDGDDYWTDPEKIQLQADFLLANPEFNVVFHPVSVVYEDMRGSDEVIPANMPSHPSLEQLVNGNFISTSSVMYRWRFPGGLPRNFDRRALPADWYLHLLHAETGRIGFIDRNMSTYRRHAGGIWANSGDPLKLHKQHGRAEISLFSTLQNHFGGWFAERFRQNATAIARILISHYLEYEEYDDLAVLVRSHGAVCRRVFSDAGLRIGRQHVATPEALAARLRSERSVSVVVTAYHHEAYIARCLESILAQRGCFTLDVIVCDDASTDGSAEIIERFRSEYPDKIRSIVSDKNLGMRPNLRRGLRASRGRYVALCEGDDYWLSSKKLAKQIQFLEEHLDCGMCFNWILLHDEALDSYIPHAGQSAIEGPLITFAKLAVDPITANFSSCMYRGDLAREIPEEYYGSKDAADWLFNLFIAKRAKVGFIRELLSVYTLHEKGLWSGLSDHSKSQRQLAAQAEFPEIFGAGQGLDDSAIRCQVKRITAPRFDGLFQACLDAPAHGASITISTGKFTIRGWALSNWGREIEIVVRDGDTILSAPVDGVRADVIRVMLGQRGEHHPRRFCGFSIDVDYRPDRDLDVGLRADGEVTWWLTLAVKGEFDRSGKKG